MATKNETLISELKINYLTEELYAEALANGQINNDEIYMTPSSDLSIYATKEELEKYEFITISDIDTICGNNFINEIAELLGGFE